MVMAGVLLLFLMVGLYFGWGVFQWFKLAWNLWRPADTTRTPKVTPRPARPREAMRPGPMWN